MNLWGIDLGGTKIEGAIIDPARPSRAVWRLRAKSRTRRNSVATNPTLYPAIASRFFAANVARVLGSCKRRSGSSFRSLAEAAGDGGAYQGPSHRAQAC
jgi:hypothetical protein